MAIPQGFLQDLIARVDVVELVGRHVQLKKTGANYSGLCPFHSEKSPSFTVSPTKQFFHCFGCGKSGDAIGFLMEHSGMGFMEAVTDLAGSVGMVVPDDERSAQDKARAQAERERQSSLFDVLEKAAAAYRHQLKGATQAIDYLKGRGLSGDVAKRFGMGYAPPGWRHLASVFADYADARLVDSGLVISGDGEEGEKSDKRYDRFRDRIMFPIRNVKGECIGFGGRVMGDEKPKYLNSPETPVFSKGRELYGLFEARQAIRDAGYALVTEGYMDVVALAQLGFEQSVATLGTACTADHVRMLFRFTDSVVFSFDGDAAGRRAARKALDAALPWASDTRSVKFLFLPPEHDPDSFIRAHGAEAFARFVSDATPLSRFLIDAAREGCDLSAAEGRALLASQAKPLWQALPDGALKRQLLGEIAELVQLPQRELQDLWGTAKPATSNHGPDRGFSKRPNTALPQRSTRTAPSTRADHACRLLLTEPDLWPHLSAQDHALLGELPPPHGPLLAWLEAQVHEHGPLSWRAWREGLRGQAFEALAVRVVGDLVEPAEETAAPSSADQGALQELKSVLNGLLIEQLEQQKNEAIAAVGSDPEALKRYQELDLRWRLAKGQKV